MEPIAEVLGMLKRQAELEGGMHQPGGLRVTEEREIYLLRESQASDESQIEILALWETLRDSAP